MLHALSQMIWCLLGALLAGWLIGHGMRGLRAARERDGFESDWRGRLDSSSRDLEARAARLRDVEGKYNALLASSSASESELGKLKLRIGELEPLTVQLGERDRKLGLLDADLRKERETYGAELADLRRKLAEAEKWRTQFDEANAAAKANNDKLAAAQKRIGELEPLNQQIAQRDAKIRELEALRAEIAARDKRIQELEGLRGQLAERDGELGKLRARLGEIDTLSAQVRDWTSKHNTVQTRFAEVDTDREKLRKRIAELEPLTQQLAQRDAKIRELEALRAEIAARDKRIQELEGLRGQLAERDGELGKLRARLGEIDTLSAQVRDWTSKHNTVQTRFAEVDTDREKLRRRIAELEPLSQQIAQRDAKIRELEALRSQIAERDAKIRELEALRAEIAARDKRIVELEGLRGQIAERDARLRDLEALRPQLQQRDVRLRELEPLSAQVQQRDGRIRDLDGEIARLKARIAELDPLAGQIRERDTRLQTLDTDLRATRAKVGALEPFEREVNTWRVRYGDLETRTNQGFRTRDTEIERLRKLLQELRARPPERIEIVREVKVQAPAEPVEPRAPRVRRVRKAVVRPAPKPKVRKARRRTKDDLKLIYGVGPKLEKFLNRRGIHYFRQVARWDTKDINRFEADLPEFKGRIKREGWVKSARAEHLKKYGREP
jgi:predicted flap endonuclease-1-like 5' DNA nuclease/peptidoglycan hydrolase CwlO-like protein